MILYCLGDVGVNELMSQLMQVVDMFTEQQIIECKEEEERTAREMIKVEQDQAYQQSLEVDRYIGKHFLKEYFPYFHKGQK